jgi:hypothetical protein
MRAFLKLLKQIITAGSGVSSKRVCGLLGWLVLLICLGYAAWCGTELPLVTSDFIFGTIVLLGVDSVTAIWKKFPNKVSSDSDLPKDCNCEPFRYEEPMRESDFPNNDRPEPGSLNNAQL